MEETSRLPEGMEWLIEAWPKFEDDAPVKLGDMALIDGDADMVEAVQIWIHGKPVIYGDNGSQQLEKGERVKRPVLAADGEPLEVGQTVYLPDGMPVYVTAIGDMKAGQKTVFGKAGNDITDSEWQVVLLTHHRPVLDADGVPIELGDDLYSIEGSLKLRVSNIDRINCRIATSAMFALDKWTDPSMFTHAKPEPPDTYAKLYEDVHDERCGSEEFVRRCKALAERGER